MEDKPVTRLLQEWKEGNAAAADALIPLVYDELRRLAARLMSNERKGHTLAATALVNEAYMRLAGTEIEWQNRVHFFALSARLMRRILVDHAKSNGRKKRGGEVVKVALDDAAQVSGEQLDLLPDLDEALERLAAFDPRKAQMMELLYFGGLTYEEAATFLGVSVVTIHREHKLAKAWLYRELSA